MLIAIISDIHDNLVNLTKCLNWCNANKIKTIICCGDITNNPLKQMVTACAEGAIAANSVFREISSQ